MAFPDLGNYNRSVAVTLSDSVNFDGSTYSATAATKAIPCDAIYIGTKGATGTAVVVYENGATGTFVGLTAGTILPVKIIRVNNSTTDVSNVVALYHV